MTKGDKELAIVFGGAGALLLVYLFWPKGQSVVNPPAVVAPAVTAPQNNVVLQPGETAISPAPNSQVTLTLPAGATWPTGGSGVTTTASILDPSVTAQVTGTQTQTTFTFSATSAKTLYATWIDGTGTPQTTRINMYLAMS